MHGLFATDDIEAGTRFAGSYTGEAISSSQMITRTEQSDKLMKINKHVVDGTDPRMASYLSMANTCPPRGDPNTMAWAIEDSKEVYFFTLRDIYEGEQILWQYHDIFDAPDDLADFADPSSCDLEMEEWQSPSATAVANDSNGPTCPSGHSTGKSRADDTGYQCSRCLEYVKEGATLWSCDHYTCDFDICCLCCEAWLLRTKAIKDEENRTDHKCMPRRSQLMQHCAKRQVQPVQPNGNHSIPARHSHRHPTGGTQGPRAGHGCEIGEGRNTKSTARFSQRADSAHTEFGKFIETEDNTCEEHAAALSQPPPSSRRIPGLLPASRRISNLLPSTQ
jgi:hypothetical protein